MVTRPDDTSVYVADEPVDRGRVVLPITVTHGRSGFANQPDAPTCAFDWVGEDPPGQVGDALMVVTQYPTLDRAGWVDPGWRWQDPGTTWLGFNAVSVRFAGSIGSLTAIEEDGQVTGYEVTGIGVLARLGNIHIRANNPKELDTVRVARLMANAGITDFRIDGTASLLLAEDEGNRSLLSALHEICAWTGALLWQDRAGTIVYGAYNHRDQPAVQVLDAEQIADGMEWSRDQSNIINRVTVGWVDDDGDHTTLYQDAASVVEWGQREASVDTRLWDGGQALVGQMVLFRRSQPRWVMPGVLIDGASNTDPQERAALDLDVSHGVLLPVSPVPGPTPSPVSAWSVEGWVDVIDTFPTMQLSLTDRTQYSFGTINTWSDVAAQSWRFWSDRGTWRDQLVKAGA